MAQLVGRAYVKVDGKMLRTNPGAKLDLGGVVRSPVVGSDVHGYAESIKESTIECEISLAKGESLEDVRAITQATVTFECDTGQVYLVRDAFVTETLSITSGEGGKIPVKLAGQPAEEVTR